MLRIDFCFKEYIANMSDETLESYAQQAGTTSKYIKRSLIYKTKVPRPEMIEALASASNGDFSKEQFVAWLYDLNLVETPAIQLQELHNA